MKNADIFLDLYKQLEKAAVEKYGFRNDGSQVRMLSRRNEFKGLRNDLDYVREVRNLLSHRPLVKKDYAVEPTDAMVEFLQKVIDKVKSPLTAEKIMVPIDKVLYKSDNDRVYAAMLEMNEKNVTRIPIISNGHLLGIFSYGIVMRYLILYREKAEIPENMLFSDILGFLPPSFKYENCDEIGFIGRNTTVSEISDMFEQSIKDDRKLVMLFVTESGKGSERIMGIITPRDVAAVV